MEWQLTHFQKTILLFLNKEKIILLKKKSSSWGKFVYLEDFPIFATSHYLDKNIKILK